LLFTVEWFSTLFSISTHRTVALCAFDLFLCQVLAFSLSLLHKQNSFQTQMPSKDKIKWLLFSSENSSERKAR
jgi:hypothetical protein